MGKGLLLVVLLSISAAQFMPSCQGGADRTVVGWVEEKYYHGRRQSHVVVINNVEYNVPDDFYALVDIGDLVKSEGGIWTIVRKRGT